LNSTPDNENNNLPKESSLKQRTIKGLLWSFSDLIANQGIQFIIQIILARLLLPEHFGIIGMILVFIAISNSIIDSGVSQALIREQNSDQADYSTAFYFNLLMSFVMYGILYCFAPAISSFFKEPELNLILRILSIGLIINSIGLIQRAQIIKKIDFKTQTKINICAGILSGLISIIFATLGFGVWSLIVKSLSMQFIQTVLLWVLNGWKPSLVFKYDSFKRLFGFGSKLMIANLFSNIYSNIYFILIGKFYSAAQLGYFTNASKLNDVASQSLTSALQSVTYPVLSSIQNDEERLKVGFRKIIKTITYINFPFMIGLAAIANPLVHLLFGDKWMSMVIYFQLLSFAGMLYPLNAINLNILQVKGKSDLYLLISIVKKVFLTILIVATIWIKFGVIGLVVAAVIDSYSSFWINSYFSGREILYSSIEQVKDITLVYVISICMGVIVYFSGVFLPVSDIIKIMIQIGIGSSVYIGISILTKIKALNEIVELLKPLLKIVMVRKIKLGSKS
jgi:O-antigen/teichoic acid export membrane protein